jgi:hypothetical protein
MKKNAKQGDWVKIHFRILEPHDRPDHIPEETRKTPLDAYVNGFMSVEEAQLGDRVSIRTLIDREYKGTLVEVFPAHTHSFGKAIPALLEIGPKLRAKIREGADDHRKVQ